MKTRWSNPETTTPSDLLAWISSNHYLTRRKQFGLPTATNENLAVPDNVTWGEVNDYRPKFFDAPDANQPGHTVAEARGYLGKATGYISKDSGGKNGDPLPSGKRRTHENRTRKEAAAALIDPDLTRTIRRWVELRTAQVHEELDLIDAQIDQLHDELSHATQGFYAPWCELYMKLVYFIEERQNVEHILTGLEQVTVPDGMSWNIFDRLSQFDVLGLEEINRWIGNVQDVAVTNIENRFRPHVRQGLMSEQELLEHQRFTRQIAFARPVLNQLQRSGADPSGVLLKLMHKWLHRLDQSIRLRLRRIISFFGQTGNVIYGSRWNASFASDRRDSDCWREDELAERGLMLDPQVALAVYSFIASPTDKELTEAEQSTGPPTVPLI